MSKKPSIFFASKSSRLRWIVLALLVGSAFSIDHLLSRDIGKQVKRTWIDSCAQSQLLNKCEQRTVSHHSGCFESAYRSMIFTFGRDRWESFKLLDYEACMNRSAPPVADEPLVGAGI